VGSEGYVYAFDPGESLLLTLRRNIQLNALNNIEVLPVAVGNDKGCYSYYPPSSTDNQGTGSLIHDPTGKSRSTTPIQVNMVRLDDFCEERKINKVDFIKIDVEGFDLEVLKGSRTILLNNPHVVVMVELADDNLKAMGIGANDIRRFMLDLKFHMYKVTGTGRLLMTSITEELKSCNGFFIRG
jgi:FkbM family methyltransferase